MNEMLVLVDHDNVDLARQGANVFDVADRILLAVGSADLSSVDRVRIRFYGGWYDGTRLTRRAQRLSSDIGSTYPKPHTVADPSSSVTVRVNAELAYSTAAAPNQHLFHTMRRRGVDALPGCREPASVGCSDPGCPMLLASRFLRTGKCPVVGCSHQLADYVERVEQKLVDTMLAVDVLHYARSQSLAIGLVTYDDDIWPAVSAALALGARIVHISPKSARMPAAKYATAPHPAYRATAF